MARASNKAKNRSPKTMLKLPDLEHSKRIEKFAFPSASDVQCRDRRRLDPSMRALFREPIAQHCGTKQKAPGLRRGLMLKQQGSAYRLAWRLAPPLGPLLGPLPRTSPVETSLTQSEPLPL